MPIDSMTVNAMEFKITMCAGIGCDHSIMYVVLHYSGRDGEADIVKELK